MVSCPLVQPTIFPAMFTKTLVSVKKITDYLYSVLPSDPGAQLSFTLYCENDAECAIKHVTGSSWIEGEGLVNLGSFTFYGEFAPYSRAAIERTVRFTLITR